MPLRKKQNIDSFIPKAEPNWKTSDLIIQTSVVVSFFFPTANFVDS